MSSPRRRFGPLLYITLGVAGATAIGIGLFHAWPTLERWWEISSLGRDLRGPNRARRNVAAQRLGKFGRAAAPTLLDAMRHTDPDVRALACTTLAMLPPAVPEAVEAMIVALGDRDEPARLAAGNFLLSVPRDRLRTAWARHGVAVDPAIRDMLRHDDPERRLLAARLLLRRGDEDRELAIGAILDIAADPGRHPEPLRLQAISSLPAEAAEARPDVVRSLVDLLNSREAKVRDGAILCLRSLGPSARAAVPGLLDLLGHADEVLRYHAACLLLNIDPARRDRPIAALARIAAGPDSTTTWRRWAMVELIRVSPQTVQELLPVLTEQLRAGDYSARAEIAMLLNDAGPQYRAAILRLLEPGIDEAIPRDEGDPR